MEDYGRGLTPVIDTDGCMSAHATIGLPLEYDNLPSLGWKSGANNQGGLVDTMMLIAESTDSSRRHHES